MAVRRKRIHDLVQRIFIRQKNVGIPIKVKNIAHLYKIKVQYEPVENNLSGFLKKDSDIKMYDRLSRSRTLFKQHQAIISVNENHNFLRQRSTIAHALGHFFLHQEETFHINHASQVKLPNKNLETKISDKEKEANLFAAELLMPGSFIEKDLQQINTLDLFEDVKLKELAKKYQVSIQALILRLAYLNYIQV